MLLCDVFVDNKIIMFSQDYVMNTAKHVSIETMQGKGVNIYIVDA